MRRSPILKVAFGTAFLVSAGCDPHSPFSPNAGSPQSDALRISASHGNLETVPYKESYEARGILGPDAECPVLQERLEGRGTATHFGRYSIINSHCLDPATGALTNGVFVKAIASGDQVLGTYSGTATPLPPEPGDPPFIGRFAINGDLQFTGGTGRFSGLSGTATMRGTSRVDFSQPAPTSEVVLRMEGEISSPGSLK